MLQFTICFDLCVAGFRFVVLFFNCLLTFGSYFCFDMPSVLQDKFQSVIIISWKKICIVFNYEKFYCMIFVLTGKWVFTDELSQCNVSYEDPFAA